MRVKPGLWRWKGGKRGAPGSVTCMYRTWAPAKARAGRAVARAEDAHGVKRRSFQRRRPAARRRAPKRQTVQKCAWTVTRPRSAAVNRRAGEGISAARSAAITVRMTIIVAIA
jgi:hypothetical protein